MERISCEYKPKTGQALLALAIFGMFTAGAAFIASTNTGGARFFRVVSLSATGFNALMWAVAALMGAMALLSLVLLANSFSGSRRLEFAQDQLTLPKSRLSSAKQTIRLGSVMSLKVVPNQKQKILKIRHSGGWADVHSGLMSSMEQFDLLCERMSRRHAELRAAKAAEYAKR